MAVSIPEFWKLALESRLLAPEHCQQLAASYEQTKGALGQSSAKSLVEWLTSINVLSKYQATVLLNGRSGPFYYGEYKVYDRIDAGRWKGGFRAVHAPTNHPVLLQFVTGAVTQDPQHWAFVVGQVHNRLSASFPYWHRFFEVVDLGNFKFLVAEDLAGDSLEQRLAQAGRIAPPEACVIVRHAALALAQLHRWQLPHGDVRPGNLWLDAQGHARLLQDPTLLPSPWPLGAADPDGSLTARADYAAPELQQPGKMPDPQTDIYSLGCCFYHMITGQPPFAGGDVAQKFQRHMAEPIQPLAPFGIPDPLAQLLTYMMAKNPAVRYPAAQMIADQLTPFVDPARLNVGSVAVSPSLPAFEQFLQQRGLGRTSAGYGAPPAPATKVASAPAPTATSPPPAPAPTPAAAPVPAPPSPGVAASAPAARVTATRSAGGPAVSAAATRSTAASAPRPATVAPARPAPATPGVRPTPVTAAGPSAPTSAAGAPSVSAAERLRNTAKTDGNRTLLFGGIAGGVLFGLILIVLIVMNSGKGSPARAVKIDSGSDVGSGNATTTRPPTGSTTGGPARGTPTDSGGAKKDRKGIASGAENKKTPDAVPSDGPPSRPGFQQTVVADDGKSLWESPTTGAAVEFQWVPPGGQFFLIVRPSDLMGSTEGPRVLRALGPTLTTSIDEWEKAAGVKFSDVELLILSLHDNGEEFPRPSMVVRLKTPLPTDELVERWRAQPGEEKGKAAVFKGANWSYCIPQAADNRLFLMGAAEEVKEVAEIGGAPPALRREMEKLRRMTDDQRHFTILLAPNYLSSTMFRDGRKFYFGEATRLREPLDWFLRDELQAAMFSLHTAGDTYLELRLSSNLNKERFKLAEEFRDRLEKVPDLAFDYIATLGSNPYWERVRLQYPNMIRFLHGKTRIGVEEDTATINARLPGPAAHNLAFGTEMVLMSSPGAAAVTAVAAKPAATASAGAAGLQPAKMTIDDVLAKYKTTMAFEAQSLELALLDIAKDVNESLKGLPFEFKIKIMGEDLRLDGITRNQTVRDFNQRDKAIGEILTAMVMKANPVTTVKAPSEKDQKLLWVVEKDPEDPSKQVVLITTRQISEQKKYKLPPAFELK